MLLQKSTTYSTSNIPEIKIRLRRWILLLGALHLLSMFLNTFTSFGMAPIAPFGENTEIKKACFEQWATKLDFLGLPIRAFVGGESALKNVWIFRIVYTTPLLISMCTFLGLLALLVRRRDSFPNDIPKLLFVWSALFACGCIAATPVFVQDFWLSAGWGRMVANGQNPYYVNLSSEITKGLPLGAHYFHLRMTYGPLWAILSGVIMLLTGDNVVFSAILFKVVLAGAWLSVVFLVWRLLQNETAQKQSLAIALVGWMPLSARETIANGHNDILMVLGLLLWLYYVERSQPMKASLALTMSVLFKYVTVPLFVLDFLHARFRRNTTILAYLRQIVPSVILAIVVFSPFYRSWSFFESTAKMISWWFFTPTHGVREFGYRIGVDLAMLGRLVRAFFPVLALYSIGSYCLKKGQMRFRYSALAIMSAILYSIVGHVWSWFLIWVLPLAALIPCTRLSKWAFGVSLGAPFSILLLFANQPRAYGAAVLTMYGIALMWFVLTLRFWIASDYISEMKKNM